MAGVRSQLAKAAAGAVCAIAFVAPSSMLMGAGAHADVGTTNPHQTAASPVAEPQGVRAAVTVDQPPNLVSIAGGDGFGVAIVEPSKVIEWEATGSPELHLVDGWGPNSELVETAVADLNSYILTADGVVHQLPRGDSDPTPLDFDGIGGVSSIAASKDTLFLVTEEGALYTHTAGQGLSGDPHAEKIIEVAASSHSLVVRRIDGGVAYGSQEAFNEEGIESLEELKGPPEFEHLVAAPTQFFGMTTDGQGFSWGLDEGLSELGLPSVGGEVQGIALVGDSLVVVSEASAYAFSPSSLGAAQPHLQLFPSQVLFNGEEAEVVESVSERQLVVAPPKGYEEAERATVVYSARLGEAVVQVAQVPAAVAARQDTDPAKLHEPEERALALAGLSAEPAMGEPSWCDANADKFYTLSSTQEFGQVFAKRPGVVIQEFSLIPPTDPQGPRIVPTSGYPTYGKIFEEEIGKDTSPPGGHTTWWFNSPGGNGLGVSNDGLAYFTFQYTRQGTPRQYVDVWSVDLTEEEPQATRVKQHYRFVDSLNYDSRIGDPYVSGGAVNPVDGNYYFSAYDGTDRNAPMELLLWRFDPDEEDEDQNLVRLRPFIIPEYGTPKKPNEVEGDIAFDGDGNLHLTIGSSEEASFGVIPSSQLVTEGDPHPIPLSGTYAYRGLERVAGPGGIGYSPLGYSILASEAVTLGGNAQGIFLNLLDPNTWDSDYRFQGIVDAYPHLRDLATCTTPPTIEIQKELTERVHTTDQFLFGGGLNTPQGPDLYALGDDARVGVSTETQGGGVGLQDQKVGPELVLLTGEDEVTVAEAAAGGSETSDISVYQPTVTCVNEAALAPDGSPNVLRDRGPLTEGGSGVFTSEPIPIDVAPSGLGASMGPRVRCTVLNDPTGPVKTAKPKSGSAVNPGDKITYTLTFANPSAVEGERSPVAWSFDYTDHLEGLLDAGDLLDAAGQVNNVSPHFIEDGTVQPHPDDQENEGALLDYDLGEQTLRLRGMIEPGDTYTVSFSAKVKPAETIGSDQGPLAEELLELTNYLVPTGDPLPENCDPATNNALVQCVRHPLRAWTVEKLSTPPGGTPIQASTTVDYHVKITNLSDDPWENIVIEDDLTETLMAATWDPSANIGFGVSYYAHDFDGGEPPPGVEEILFETGSESVGDPEVYCGDTLVETEADYAPCLRPVLGEQSRVPFYTASDPPDSDAPVGAKELRIVLQPGPINMEIAGGEGAAPVLAKVAVIRYSVQGGYVADPLAVDEPFRQVNGNGGGGRVSAVPDAHWVNTVSANPATLAGEELPSIRCSMRGPDFDEPIPPGGVEEGEELPYGECKTTHSLMDAYFHIGTHGLSLGGVTQNLEGAEYLISDTKADAQAERPSKWLCHTNNNPYANWGAPEEELIENPDYVKPGSEDSLGDPDFGYGSPTYAAIRHWNKERFEPEDKKPLCGIMFSHTAGEANDGQPIGSWHVEGLQGGATVVNGDDLRPDPNWRNGPQGTYWLVETKAPKEHQLLAEPMQFWVAPAVESPPELLCNTWDYYNFQSRLSFPESLDGDTMPFGKDTEGKETVIRVQTGPSSSYQEGRYSGARFRDIRASCPCELNPLGGTNLACNMPAGWNMEVYNVRSTALPLTGGSGTPRWVLLGSLLTVGVLVTAVRQRTEYGERGVSRTP